MWGMGGPPLKCSRQVGELKALQWGLTQGPQSRVWGSLPLAGRGLLEWQGIETPLCKPAVP